MTTWIVILAGVWLVFTAGLYLKMLHPVQRFYGGFFDIQKKAYADIDGGRSLEFATKNGLRLAYYISREGDKYLHRVQGYAPGKPQQFLIDNMILVVGKLTKNFDRVGLGEGPNLDIREAGGGSHLISYSLTEDQHRRLAPLFKDRVKRPRAKANKPTKVVAAKVIVPKKMAVAKKLAILTSDPLPEIKG